MKAAIVQGPGRIPSTRFSRARSRRRRAPRQGDGCGPHAARPRPRFGRALQRLRRVPVRRRRRRSGQARGRRPRLLPAAARALRRLRRRGRRVRPAVPARARRSRRRDGGGDRQPRHVVLGRADRPGEARPGRDRARQRRDRNLRPARGADRQTSRREEGDRDGPEPRSAGLPRRRRDHCARRRRRRARGELSRRLRRNRRRRARLPVGPKRGARALPPPRRPRRNRARSTSFRSARRRPGRSRCRADVLRSTPITIMGSGLGSVPGPRLLAAIGAVLAAAKPAGLAVAARAVPLADVGAVWTEAGDARRVVFVP